MSEVVIKRFTCDICQATEDNPKPAWPSYCLEQFRRGKIEKIEWATICPACEEDIASDKPIAGLLKRIFFTGRRKP